MQIVLARLDEGQTIERHGRIDLGERHAFKRVDVPVACMWLNDGSEGDVEKAKAYAAQNGYSVLCYSGEKNPLDRARQDIMRRAR